MSIKGQRGRVKGVALQGCFDPGRILQLLPFVSYRLRPPHTHQLPSLPLRMHTSSQSDCWWWLCCAVQVTPLFPLPPLSVPPCDPPCAHASLPPSLPDSLPISQPLLPPSLSTLLSYTHHPSHPSILSSLPYPPLNPSCPYMPYINQSTESIPPPSVHPPPPCLDSPFIYPSVTTPFLPFLPIPAICPPCISSLDMFPSIPSCPPIPHTLFPLLPSIHPSRPAPALHYHSIHHPSPPSHTSLPSLLPTLVTSSFSLSSPSPHSSLSLSLSPDRALLPTLDSLFRSPTSLPTPLPVYLPRPLRPQSSGCHGPAASTSTGRGQGAARAGDP